MLGYIEIVSIYFLKDLIFSIKARRGLHRQIDAGKTPRSVKLRRVADSEQC